MKNLKKLKRKKKKKKRKERRERPNQKTNPPVIRSAKNYTKEKKMDR